MDKKNQRQADLDISRLGMMRIAVGMMKTGVFGLPDPVYEKYTLFKKIKKKLKRMDIKGVNLSKDRLSGDFGVLLFQIYRYFYPLRAVIDLGKPSQVKGFSEYLIKSFCTDKQTESLTLLTSEKFIRETLLKEGAQKAAKKFKETYKELANSFTKEQVKKVNFIYSLGESFYHFLKLDLYPFLKKFSPDLREDNVLNPPAFREVEMQQAEPQLKELADHLHLLNLDANYYEFMIHYGNFIGKEIIPQEDFQKFFQILQTLVKSGYLTLLVQYISNDVFFKPISVFQEKNIFNEFMKTLVSSINGVQEKTANQLKNQKIEQVVQDLFGQTNFAETTAYTYEQNEYLIKNGIGTLTYVDSFNVLKKFMLDKYNRYLRKSLHTFILKATFASPAFSESMNSHYYQFNALMDKILDFEAKMKSKEGWDRILTLVRGKTRDASLAYLAKKNLNELNQEVRKMLDTAVELTEGLKEKLKVIVESFNKGSKDPISNIKNFAGLNTSEIVKSLAQGFNDLAKLSAYFKMVIK